MIPSKSLLSGFSLPHYGLGLWLVGGRLEADSSKESEEIGTIIKAVERGITHIDTAELYGDGNAEVILGQALKELDRSKLFIASKVSQANQSYDNLKRSLEGSLKRMGADYLDLYMLHRFPPVGVAIEETMQALNELADEKLIRSIGVCNFSVNRLKAAQAASARKIVCNQVHYNLQVREMESEGVLDYCQNNDVMLVAWRPVFQGNLPENELLRKLANKYQKTIYQLAINWLVSQKNVVTLVKTSNINHLDENLEALGWQMESEDIELLRSNFPGQLFKSNAVPLDYAGSLPA